MIELIFFAPDHLRQQTFYDRVTALEIFWEEEWPRFGEDVCDYFLTYMYNKSLIYSSLNMIGC